MRLLLIKSTKFANQAGYYLLQGRWHSISQDKPAPKGAPIAAHPEAAGKHAPAKHLTDDEWAQLKLPETNVNAPSYNKHLDKLKQMSEAGHVTGILGMQYGTNTYGKKASIVANHLLDLHGSEHKVQPGQKAGEHEAVKQAPAQAEPKQEKQKEVDYLYKIENAANTSTAQMFATLFYHSQDDKAAAQAMIDSAMDVFNAKQKADDEAGSQEAINAPAELTEQQSDLAVPEFAEGKQAKGVKAHYEKTAKNIISAAKAGDLSALQFMPKDTGNTWKGKTDNSKKLMALHEQAIAYAQANKPESKEIQHPVTESKKDEALNAAIDHLKEDAKQGDLPKEEQKEDQALVSKLEAAVEPEAKSDEPAKSDVGSKLSQIPWDSMLLPDTNKNAKSHNGKVAHIKAMAEAGDIDGLKNFKAGVNTYGKKQNLLAQTALAALEESEAADPEPIKAEPKAPEPATGGKPAKPELNKFYFGTANTIEEAFSSGNKPQLESLVQMTAQLKGVNEDGTKVHEYAVDALSYLQDQDGSAINVPPEQPVEQDASDASVNHENDGPKEGETKQGADGTLIFQNGRWHKQGEPVKPAPSGPADVEIPKYDSPIAKNNEWLNKASTLLKEKVAAEGKAGFKGILTNHKNGAVTVKIGNIHVKNAHVDGKSPQLVKFAKFVDELKASVSKQPKKAKQAPKPQSVAPQQSGAVETMDHWTQTGGQGGSNPGGKFKDDNGTEWYCKFPESEDVAKAEVLAAKLYAAAGIAGQDAKFITKGGKLGIASKWQTVNKASPKDLAAAPGVLSGFAVDAWLANWDVVGLGYDNMQLNEAGHAVRVDAGGSLMYRAQGGKKAFGDHVTELDSLRDAAINPQAASVFGKMTEADITASVAKVLRISDAKIAKLVNEFGPGNEQEKQAIIKTLIARKNNLAEKFPKAKKAESKPKFDASKISAPPDFMNWGGPGVPGPSSKQFLNEANNVAAQHIYEAAKAGDINAVQALQEPVYNKATGEVMSQSPVLEHPSQHIKGYAKQVINEIDYQMNPPKKFRLGGDHPLNALNASYPAAKGKIADAKKLGEFIVLGEPGTIDIESLGMPKITYAAGKLTKQTYVKQAHAAVEKMPQTQLQAVQAYTGSSYKSMNSSLWAGNPSGQAKAAAEALHTLAHDVEPGTILSRKISLPSSDVAKLTKSVGKVLQEPAIMSTSIRPSSWSGNVHLKLHVGPGVKGLWVGPGSMPGGGALSYNSGEDEMVLPPNTRLLILSSTAGGSTDSDGFGSSSKHIIEALILPSEGY